MDLSIIQSSPFLMLIFFGMGPPKPFLAGASPKPQFIPSQLITAGFCWSPPSPFSKKALLLFSQPFRCGFHEKTTTQPCHLLCGVAPNGTTWLTEMVLNSLTLDTSRKASCRSEVVKT